MGDYLKAPDGDGYWWWRANGDDEPQLARVTGFCLGKPKAYFCTGGIMTPPFWGYWERAIVKPPGDKEASLLVDLSGFMEKVRKLAKGVLPDYSENGEAVCALQICEDELDKLVEKYK